MKTDLDHFVVHIDNDEALLDDLKTRLATCGVPFEPTWGKGTKGFKAANIWIGSQYFEIVRLLRPDGGGWVPKWVERHQAGKRGLYCLFLETDELDTVVERLHAAGIEAGEPERITFRGFLGLFKKTMPWRVLYLPTIPGTDLEIGFIEYDPGAREKLAPYLVPNAAENGITGVTNATLNLPLTETAKTYLKQLFPAATATTDELTIPLTTGQLRIKNGKTVQVDFYTEKADSYQEPSTSVTLENVTLHI